MKNEEKTVMLLSALLTAAGIILAVGSAAVFTACGAQEDGSYMTCHYAQIMVTAMGVVLALQGLASLIMKEKKAKGAVLAAAVPVSVLVCLIPGILIPLCAMPGMHCRAMLRPAAIVIGVISAVIALIGAVSGLKGDKTDEEW